MNEETPPEETPLPKPPSVAAMIRGNLPNILGVFAVYIMGLMIGYGYPDMVTPALLANIQEGNKLMLEELQGQPVILALTVFSENLFTLYIAMAMGIVACIPSVYFLLSQGILSGTMAAREGTPLWELFSQDIPGVLEIMAACIAMGWGMKIGFSLFSPPRLLRLRQAFVEGHRVFLSAVFLLIFSAAAIGLVQTYLQ